MSSVQLAAAGHVGQNSSWSALNEASFRWKNWEFSSVIFSEACKNVHDDELQISYTCLKHLNLTILEPSSSSSEWFLFQFFKDSWPCGNLTKYAVNFF